MKGIPQLKIITGEVLNFSGEDLQHGTQENRYCSDQVNPVSDD